MPANKVVLVNVPTCSKKHLVLLSPVTLSHSEIAFFHCFEYLCLQDGWHDIGANGQVIITALFQLPEVKEVYLSSDELMIELWSDVTSDMTSRLAGALSAALGVEIEIRDATPSDLEYQCSWETPEVALLTFTLHVDLNIQL